MAGTWEGPPDAIDQHLAPNDIALYIDHAVSGERRGRIEAHLARCAECRAELTDSARITATFLRPVARRRVMAASSVALLMLAALVIFGWAGRLRVSTGQHHEPAFVAAPSPVAIAPAGIVHAARRFAWSAVPHADRYHFQLFDSDGAAVWQRETKDTTLALPPYLQLVDDQTFYWQVRADYGPDGHASSELTSFLLRR